jgi:hypothetical protein
MKRREAIRAIAATSIASLTTNSFAADGSTGSAAHKKSVAPVTHWHPTKIDKIMLGNSHFLSKTNPLATADQRDLEALALKVMQMPVVVKAREAAKRRYRMLVGKQASEEAWARFNDEMFEEYVFRYVQIAVNSDANYPKVMGALHCGPHQWFDMKVPGGRSGEGDGPDTNYSMMPIAWDAHYEVHGKRFFPTVADKSYALIADFGITTTTGFLPAPELKISTDDTFVITIGPEPVDEKAGRSNHIQTTPDTNFLLIRNNRADWKQIPDAYRIRRMDPPSGPPLTIDQLASRAAFYIQYDVANNYMLNRYMTAIEQNKVIGPFDPSTMGGLKSQRAAFGYLKLADDEAFVITLSGNVPYRSITLFDFWFRSFDYWNRTSNLNNAQTADNPDGSATFIVSIQDPGVHNWLDPAGFHEPIFWIRWQGRDWVSGEAPKATAQLVKLKDIDTVLPAGMKRISPEERKQQLAERLEHYKLRFVL